MFDDKNRSQGIQGFDEALPVEEGKDSRSPSDETVPEAGRQQGYTVTPAGGYYSGGDARQNSTAQSEAGGTAGEAKTEQDMPEQAAAETQTAQTAPSQSDRPGEYHYSAAAGNIPFSGSENRPAGDANGSWQTDGRQNGYGQSGSYTPPSYGFMPNGTYGSQNYGSSPYGTQPAYNSQPARPAKPPKAPRPKKEGKPLLGQFSVKTFVACVLAAAVVGLGAGAGGFALTRHLTGDVQSVPSQTSGGSTGSAQTISIQGEVENLVQAVAEKVSPSVVGIRTTAASNSFFGGQNASSGEGSGIIYSEDGYIITNYHVIQAAAEQGGGSSRVQVFLPSDPENGIDASIVGYNIAYDLAVLKINQTGLPAAEIGDSDDLNVGQYVVAIGNPGGLDFMGSVTYGVISGLNRKITTDNSTQLNLIQTDAAINPGNSGGALVNSKGQVIGVNSVKLVSTGYESMGFAIPMNQVVETCKQIISKENAPTPYLGIEISTKYDAQTLQMLGYPTGAVVQSVVEGSPAADAGLQRSDIITEFAGTTVSSYTTLSSAISQCSPGETVNVKVYRGGRYYTAEVTLGTNNVQTAK